MARTQLEYYDALKAHVGEEGARLIAEIVPVEEYVTRDYLDLKLTELKAEMRGWMLGFFVPLWIGVYLTLAAIVVSIFVQR
jgi:hypothetical protein